MSDQSLSRTHTCQYWSAWCPLDSFLFVDDPVAKDGVFPYVAPSVGVLKTRRYKQIFLFLRKVWKLLARRYV
jgi:hypothetical protein